MEDTKDVKEKKCNKCLNLLSIENFYNEKSKKDGLRTICKNCTNNYYKKNIKKIKEYTKNRHNIKKEYDRIYVKNKREIDINYNLAYIVRCRLNKALKNNFKNGSAVKDLGCTIIQLKEHLEKQFQPNMTWDNHRTIWLAYRPHHSSCEF